MTADARPRRRAPRSLVLHLTTAYALVALLGVVAMAASAAAIMVRAVKVEVEVITALTQLLWAVAATAFVAMVLAIGVASLVSSRIVRPLRGIERAAERLAAGDLTARAHGVDEGEVGRLAAALNAMADQLQRRLGELEEAQDQARALLANMASGVVLIGEDGRIALANPIARDWLALAAEAVGAPYASAIRQIDLLEGIRRARASRQPWRTEMRLAPADDRVLAVSLTPVAGGRGVVMVLNDISEARRMARLRTEFIANLSHQFKTPVAVIKGYVETLLDGSLAEPEIAREFLHIVRDEADRLDWLVAQVLELARLEDPNLLLNLEDVDLREVVAAAGERFRPVAGQQGLRLDIALPDRPAPFRCDRKRIEEAIGNLLDNARKHSPPGGAVCLELAAAPGAWRISVTDEGEGIPEDVLPRVFERFFRGPGAANGTGLGLAIVKHVAEVHGGRAWAANRRYGRGAQVGIDFPRPA